MEKSVKITLIIVSAIIILALIGVFVYSSQKTGATVNANGQAEIKANPDLITVYFNVQTKGVDAKEAKDKNADIIDKVTIALLKQGFERKDIQTQNFNIYPEYDWVGGRQTQKGYATTHTIRIEMTTDKTDKIGKVIDAGVDNGASINYINFELSQEKQNQYKAQALKSATEDARIKAESIASGLGKKVGKVVSISTSDFNYYPWRAYDNSAGTATFAEVKSAATSIQPSEQSITANVQVVFEIK